MWGIFYTDHCLQLVSHVFNLLINHSADLNGAKVSLRSLVSFCATHKREKRAFKGDKTTIAKYGQGKGYKTKLLDVPVTTSAANTVRVLRVNETYSQPSYTWPHEEN